MKLLIFVSFIAYSVTIVFSSDHLEGCEHRTFQVGQGSCHTVLYSVKKSDNTFYKTLVFYDMGSSSRKVPTKLAFHDSSFDNRVFKEKDTRGLKKINLQKASDVFTLIKQKKKSKMPYKEWIALLLCSHILIKIISIYIQICFPMLQNLFFLFAEECGQNIKQTK